MDNGAQVEQYLDRAARKFGLQPGQLRHHDTAILDAADRSDEELRRPLPQIQDAYELCRREIPLPPELIQGMLHQGSKLSFGGASKGFKTWSLDNLALSVAYGLPWFGCETRRSKVLLIDLELQEAFCRRRLLTLEHALGIFQEPRRLDVWNLRGFAVGHQLLLPQIEERIGTRRLWARGCGPDLQVVRGRRQRERRGRHCRIDERPGALCAADAMRPWRFGRTIPRATRPGKRRSTASAVQGSLPATRTAC